MRADLRAAVALLVAACSGPPPSSAPPTSSSVVVSAPAPSFAPPPDVSLHGAVPDLVPSPPSTSIPVPSLTRRPGTELGPVLPVAALPSDLIEPTSSSTVSAATEGEAHADDGAPVGAAAPGEVATAWTISRTASRFDDPVDGRRHRLAALTADPAVAVAADLAAPRADPSEGGATWAIVSDVADLGDGWWRITYTLKETRDGQVGPISTPATLDVRVSGGLVVAERP